MNGFSPPILRTSSYVLEQSLYIANDGKVVLWTADGLISRVCSPKGPTSPPLIAPTRTQMGKASMLTLRFTPRVRKWYLYEYPSLVASSMSGSARSATKKEKKRKITKEYPARD